MNFTVENRGQIVIFTLKHEKVDNEISSQFKAQMLILCQPDIDALVIDMAHVEQIDSSGLGALLLAHRQLKENAIPIALVGVTGMVRTMLHISQTETLFDFYDTIDEACEDLEYEED
ncbi:MAG: anti-sigma-factor antagonist [Ignavibacteria bacterium]|nr:anti-sigma-factor antagonist [Ignavibacteria bacterium]